MGERQPVNKYSELHKFAYKKIKIVMINLYDEQKNLIKALAKVVGREDVLDSPPDLIAYSYDASVKRSLPDVVVFPNGTAEISAIVKIAHREQVPVIARGAGTNLTPQVAEAAIRVLNKHKVEVVMPDFACCGMPAYGYGDIASALTMARKNVDLALSLEIDAIITTCATCGSLLKRYPKLLSENIDYSTQANTFASKIKDISEFLMDISLNNEMGTLKHKVTYHDPCHLGRFQKITTQPRQILQSIPGVEFIEMAESNICCGAAGSYNIGHYDLSMKVLARKVQNVAKTNAEFLVTCCPGCSMQLAHGIREHHLEMKSMELVELLDLAYRLV
jgi:glycolate oxidase iron-sulfur subunit